MSHAGVVDSWTVTTNSPTRPKLTVHAQTVQGAYERAVTMLHDPAVDLLAMRPEPDLPEDRDD